MASTRKGVRKMTKSAPQLQNINDGGNSSTEAFQQSQLQFHSTDNGAQETHSSTSSSQYNQNTSQMTMMQKQMEQQQMQNQQMQQPMQQKQMEQQ